MSLYEYGGLSMALPSSSTSASISAKDRKKCKQWVDKLLPAPHHPFMKLSQAATAAAPDRSLYIILARKRCVRTVLCRCTSEFHLRVHVHENYIYYVYERLPSQLQFSSTLHKRALFFELNQKCFYFSLLTLFRPACLYSRYHIGVVTLNL